MKFMVSWHIPLENREEAYKTFSKMTAEDDKADHGDKVKLIGRWHDLSNFTGVAICETDDPSALSAWLLNWNSAVDTEVAMVLDDDETRELGRKRFG